MPLEIGDEAPDFELRSHRGGTIRLSDYRGKKNVVVAFHPLAFTPVCATQMAGYQVELPALDAADTVVLGLSIDAQPAKSAWAKTLGTITFERLLSARRRRPEVRRLPRRRRHLGASGLSRGQAGPCRMDEDLRNPRAAADVRATGRGCSCRVGAPSRAGCGG